MKKTCTLAINQKKIETSFSSHNLLSLFAENIIQTSSNDLLIDMSNVEYIASNQFAILGCIMDTYKRANPDCSLFVRGLSNSLREMTQKNGFSQHLGLPKLPDTNNTIIPYRHFSVNEIEEYERYILLYLLNRDDLPVMTRQVRNTILDYLLEVFKNVSDHTSSQRIYACGQFFPRSSMLFFTIVDSGETIPYNVNSYFKKHNQSAPLNTLLWALQEGHTTSDDGPRGIGLSLIKTFIHHNKGSLYIVSGNSTYEITKNGERYKKMEHSFPGTIVTLAFNLKDDAAYYMESGSIQEIQF